MEKMSTSKGKKGGRIINIASMAGLLEGMQDLDGSGYSVSKFGVKYYTYQFLSYPWLQIVTQVIIHNLGNKMLGQAGPNSITQVMIYNLGYDL